MGSYPKPYINPRSPNNNNNNKNKNKNKKKTIKKIVIMQGSLAKAPAQTNFGSKRICQQREED